MKLTHREFNILGVLIALLFVGLAFVYTSKKLPSIRETRGLIESTRQTIGLRQSRIARKAEVSLEFDKLQAMLPVYAARKDVATELTAQIEQQARKTGLNLLKIEPEGEEKEMTEGVFQMQINCSFKATGAALVKFLYLTQSKGGALDVSYLRHEPITREKGFVNGRFIMDCAYRRQSGDLPVPAPAPVPVPAPGPPGPAAGPGTGPGTGPATVPSVPGSPPAKPPAKSGAIAPTSSKPSIPAARPSIPAARPSTPLPRPTAKSTVKPVGKLVPVKPAIPSAPKAP